MKIKIEGCGTLDGEHEFDDDYFLNGELHVIKRETDLRLGDLNEAIERRDNDVAVALAIAALMRNGHPMNKAQCQLLWNAPAGSSITLDFDESAETEADARPPDTQIPSGNESNSLTSTQPESSGLSSNGTGDDHQVSDPSLTGSPGSDIGATSESPTSP